MAEERMARTYAQAIFDKAVESWMSPLKTINAAIARENLTGQLDDSQLAFAKKEELLRKVVPANAATEVQNLVKTLVKENDVHLLPDVIVEFQRFIVRGPDRPVARVASAVELKADEKKSLEAKLEKQFGEGLEFAYAVDAGLLGGVVVRVGDKVIDGSLAGRLAALKEKLTS